MVWVQIITAEQHVAFQRGLVADIIKELRAKGVKP
jgi:hypothetical protein